MNGKTAKLLRRLSRTTSTKDESIPARTLRAAWDKMTHRQRGSARAAIEMQTRHAEDGPVLVESDP